MCAPVQSLDPVAGLGVDGRGGPAGEQLEALVDRIDRPDVETAGGHRGGDLRVDHQMADIRARDHDPLVTGRAALAAEGVEALDRLVDGADRLDAAALIERTRWVNLQVDTADIPAQDPITKDNVTKDVGLPDVATEHNSTLVLPFHTRGSSANRCSPGSGTQMSATRGSVSAKRSREFTITLWRWSPAAHRI